MSRRVLTISGVPWSGRGPKPYDGPALPESTVYILHFCAWDVTWKQWKKIGGCGLSQRAQKAFTGIHPSQWNSATLGALQRNCVLAGRELARFAKEHLNRPTWAVVEYEGAIMRLDYTKYTQQKGS